METEKGEVSGLYLRGVLAGLRKIAGENYGYLLEQAGLAAYSQKYPPATFEPIATVSQLTSLLRAVNEVVGAAVFKLFFANLGRTFGLAMSTLPELQAKSRELAESPHLIPTLVRSIGELHFLAVGGLVETIQTQPNQLHIIYRDCIYCSIYPHSDLPVCVNLPTLYKQILLNLTNQRCTMHETRCAAVEGERDCHFSLLYNIG